MALTSRTQTAPATERNPNWLELPPDLMATILLKVGVIEILTIAQNVCTAWRRICKDPAMWRVMNIHIPEKLFHMKSVLDKLCRHAVDLSEGKSLEINIQYIVTDGLLQYIAQRSSQLKCLRLVCCDYVSSEGSIETVKTLPLLEELCMYNTPIRKEAIEAVGRCCPLLKTFKIVRIGWRTSQIAGDEEALAIAENMPKLRHFLLFGHKMTRDGLQTIVDSCPHLESFDLQKCLSVSLAGNLGRGCSEQIEDTKTSESDFYDEEYLSDIEF